MAATVAIASDQLQFPAGHLRGKFITVTGDNSYSAGGYTITAAQCGLQRIVSVIPGGIGPATSPASGATTGRAVMPVIGTAGVNVAIRFMGPAGTAATTAELTETTDTDLSATSVQLLVIGV